MNENIGIIIIGIIIFFIIAEIFGRSKHIGRWWAFLLLIGGLIPGIIALLFSPSAKDSPTKADNSYKIWAIICFILGIINLIGIGVSKGQYGHFFFIFIILGIYLFYLSEGLVINREPKYYFTIHQNQSSTEGINSISQKASERRKISIDEQKQSIQILKDKGVLTETEYQEKINIIVEQIIIDKIHKSTEYLNLKRIFESELLTKEQFDEKVNKLIADYKEYNSIFGENNYSEFTWELFQNMKINKRINPYEYRNSDLLGKWKFKNGQLFLYTENGSNKLKVTWTNNFSRYGEWDLTNNLLNVRLYKSLGFDKEFFHIDELGSHIFVYFVNDKKYTCFKDLSKNKNV